MTESSSERVQAVLENKGAQTKYRLLSLLELHCFCLMYYKSFRLARLKKISAYMLAFHKNSGVSTIAQYRLVWNKNCPSYSTVCIGCTYQTRPADPPALQWPGQSLPASLQHSYTCLQGAGSLAGEEKR